MDDARIDEVRRLRNSGLSFQTIGEMVGVSGATIRRWLLPPEKLEEERGWRLVCTRKWRKAHPEHDAEYYSTHREQQAITSALYYANNKEKQRIYRLSYRAANLEKVKERHAEYYAANKDKWHGYVAKRRALKLDALPIDDSSVAEVYRRAQEETSIRCFYCGDRIPLGYRHVDHVIPLSKGGKHVASNLAITHASCNLHKGAKMPEEVGVLL